MCGLRIKSLHFADDVVLVASLSSDLQLEERRFAECKAAGMRIREWELFMYISKLIDGNELQVI